MLPQTLCKLKLCSSAELSFSSQFYFRAHLPYSSALALLSAFSAEAAASGWYQQGSSDKWAVPYLASIKQQTDIKKHKAAKELVKAKHRAYRRVTIKQVDTNTTPFMLQLCLHTTNLQQKICLEGTMMLPGLHFLINIMREQC